MSNDTTSNATAVDSMQAGRRASAAVTAGLKDRYAAEKRFRAFGIAAILFALLCLATLFVTIIGTGLPAFTQTMIRLDVTLYPQDIDPEGTRDLEVLSRANYRSVIQEAVLDLFPEVTSRGDKRALMALISPGATFDVREKVMDDPSIIGQRISLLVHASDDADQLNKGHIDADLAEAERRLTDQQIAWFERLKERGLVVTRFNRTLFTNGDSRSPELAGIRGALMGSF
jgi:phosphate transport system permease protein